MVSHARLPSHFIASSEFDSSSAISKILTMDRPSLALRKPPFYSVTQNRAGRSDERKKSFTGYRPARLDRGRRRTFMVNDKRSIIADHRFQIMALFPGKSFSINSTKQKKEKRGKTNEFVQHEGHDHQISEEKETMIEFPAKAMSMTVIDRRSNPKTVSERRE